MNYNDCLNTTCQGIVLDKRGGMLYKQPHQHWGRQTAHLPTNHCFPSKNNSLDCCWNHCTTAVFTAASYLKLWNLALPGGRQTQGSHMVKVPNCVMAHETPTSEWSATWLRLVLCNSGIKKEHAWTLVRRLPHFVQGVRWLTGWKQQLHERSIMHKSLYCPLSSYSILFCTILCQDTLSCWWYSGLRAFPNSAVHWQ